MNNREILYNNRTIFYRETGRGTTVVLLHGFAEDGTIWNHIVEELKQTFHFIIPDIPGSGYSEMLPTGKVPTSNLPDPPAQIQHPTIEDFAEVMKYILDHESINECVLIGHSMGGYIALAFAEKYPERLHALGLFHSSAFADDSAKIEARLKAIEFIKSNGTQAFLKTSIPNLFADKFKQQHPQKIETLISSGNKFTPESLIQYYHAMIQRPDRTQVLKTLLKPILFIIGENDNAIPLQISLQQCHIPGISYVHILANTGHMGMLEAPITAGLLSCFINNSILF
jgi:pimeloyl-ACP methyl ester carboxylesterase